MAIATLTIDLVAKLANIERDMGRAAHVAEVNAKKMQIAFASVDTAIRRVTAGIAGGLSFHAISGLAQSLAQAQQQADKLRNSLVYSAGSTAAAAKEIEYLREVTRSLGVDFVSASAAYAKFAAATKGTGITAAQTKDIFEGIAQASAKMGLSAEEAQGALRALSQMASKGTVASEELRGQLGERLPGAFKLAAQAIGVTEAELAKMLETGQVIASDFLPKFGAILKNEFGGAVNSLTLEINRINSAWDVWKQNFVNADGGGFRFITNGLNESSAAMRELGQEAGVVRKLLAAIGGFEFGMFGASTFDLVKAQDQEIKKLTEVKRLRKELDDQQKKYGSLPPITQRRLEGLIEEEKQIREQINRLAVRRGKETGLQIPDIKGEFLAQRAKLDDQLRAYMGDTSNAPKAAKIAAQVEKENAAFKAAVAGLTETDSRYIAALKAHNERVSAIKASGEPKASKAEANEGQRLIDQLQSRLMTVEKLTELEKLEAEIADGKYSKISSGEREVAESLASQIDMRDSISRQLDEEIAGVKLLTTEHDRQAARLKQLIEATPSAQNRNNMADEAMAESALLSGNIDQTTYDQIIENLRGVKNEGKDTFDSLKDAIDGWGKSSASAIVDFALTGKSAFSDMANSIIADMMRMVVQQNITAPLAKAVGEIDFGSMFSTNADGGVYSSPSLSAYSGGVYSSPQLFKFASGAGVFGEAGPEAIMPLKRGPDGKLGVSGSGSNVVVNLVESPGSGKGGSTSTSTGSNGEQIITVLVEKIKGDLIKDVGSGGSFASAMEGQYSLNRSAGAWR